MSVTDTEVREFLARLDEGRQSWIDGKLGFGRGFDIDRDDDMTIFGPFGGADQTLKVSAASSPLSGPCRTNSGIVTSKVLPGYGVGRRRLHASLLRPRCACLMAPWRPDPAALVGRSRDEALPRDGYPRCTFAGSHRCPSCPARFANLVDSVTVSAVALSAPRSVRWCDVEPNHSKRLTDDPKEVQ